MRYTVKDLGTFGGTVTAATAVNEVGDVVGSSRTTDGFVHAFLYRDGVITDLGVPFGFSSRAVAINSSGQIVVESGGGENRSFLLANGKFTSIVGVGGASTTATGINDSGQVVGSSASHAVVYSGGTLQDLGTFGGTSANPGAINSAGRITGTYAVPKPPDVGGIESHGFVYDVATGAFRDLGEGVGAGDVNDKGEFIGASTAIGPFIDRDGTQTPLGGQGSVFALNNVGGIVGDGFFRGDLHAVIYENGRPVDLNTLIAPGSGLTLSFATDINDAGQIVGGALTASGDTHAFLLTSVVPEPAGLSVVLLGGLLLRRRRAA